MKRTQYIVLLNVIAATISLHAGLGAGGLQFPKGRVHRVLLREREKAKRAKAAESKHQSHIETIAPLVEYLLACTIQTPASSTQKQEFMQKALDALSNPQELERETKVKFADKPEVKTVQYYPIELEKGAKKQSSSIIDQSKAKEESIQN